MPQRNLFQILVGALTINSPIAPFRLTPTQRSCSSQSTFLGNQGSTPLFVLKEEFETFPNIDAGNDDADEERTKSILRASLHELEKIYESNGEKLLKELVLVDEMETKLKHVTSSIPSSFTSIIEKMTKKYSNFKVDDDDAPEKNAIKQVINMIKILLDSGVFKKDILEYSHFPPHPEYPNVDLSGAMKKLEGIPPLEYFFSVEKILGMLKSVIKIAISLKITSNDVAKAKTAEEKMGAIFTKDMMGLNPMNFAPLPQYVFDHWEEDKEFARQFLCGTNPVMIQVVKDVETQISSARLKDHFGKTELDRLAQEKRLFFVSYDDIAKLGERSTYKNPHMSHPINKTPPKPPRSNQPRFFFAPIVLFELDENRKELDIKGIQLERKPNAKVYTRENSNENEWLFVKTCVANADTQMHEWVSHLGATHLAMEPHVISIHNTLKKKNHPLYTYLKPICKDTLVLNWSAGFTLTSFGPDCFGDYMTSVGVGQFMQLIGLYWSRYDFFQSSALPSELESRGFDESFDMSGYLFREDGLKLWDAYGQFAKDFVDELYDSDEDIKNDEVLQEWAKETSSPHRAAVPGFPDSFEDKATVVKVLQTLNWIAGGLHAAVNFPQYEFITYAPNKPLGMKGEIPDEAEISRMTREEIFADRLFEIDYVQESLLSTKTLCFQAGHTIDKLSYNFQETGKKPYERFLVKLDEIGGEIEARNRMNEKKKKAVYHYLHPSVVPASVDI